MSASPKTVCIPCRRVFKGEGRLHIMEKDLATTEGPKRYWQQSKHEFKGIAKFPKKWMGNGAGMHDAPANCPVCRKPTRKVDYSWRPPRRTNKKAWRKIEKSGVLQGWWN